MKYTRMVNNFFSTIPRRNCRERIEISIIGEEQAEKPIEARVRALRKCSSERGRFFASHFSETTGEDTDNLPWIRRSEYFDSGNPFDPFKATTIWCH